MFGKNKVCTLSICSPIDIILYGYNFNEVNPLLSEIMELLNITIDVKEIEKTFVDTPCGQGDIWVFGDHAKNCIFFDLFRFPTDQLDIIDFGVVCSNKMYNRMYELIYAMYKEINKKVKFSAYDINTPLWAKSVIHGDVALNYYNYADKAFATQKIRYIK